MKIRFIFFVSIFYSSLFFLSCDVLRNTPFEVLSWTPGQTVIEDPSSISIALYFTNEPNKSNTEKAFSVSEDGNNLKGTFNWGDKYFLWKPAMPFYTNKDYVVKLSTEADDVSGLSLENYFEGHFTTKAKDGRPHIVSINPSNESIITNLHNTIQIEFNDFITVQACHNDISFTPSISGTWKIKIDGKTALFYPKESLKINETYIVKVSSYFENSFAKQLGKDWISRFTVVDEKTLPELGSVNILNTDGSCKNTLIEFTPPPNYAPSVIFENENLESKDKVQFVFSKPVEVLKLKTYLQIEPSINYKVETNSVYADEIIISFEDAPIWGEAYTLKFSAGITDENGNASIDSHLYRLKANGENSMPPKLIAIRLPENSVKAGTNRVFTVEDIFALLIIDDAAYPPAPNTRRDIKFEMYFETAKDAEINLFSLMNLFRIETTNNCISFNPTLITKKIFSSDTPHSGFENFYCAEITGSLNNSTYSGLFKLSIAAGLIDTNGNKNNNAVSIQISKTGT